MTAELKWELKAVIGAGNASIVGELLTTVKQNIPNGLRNRADFGPAEGLVLLPTTLGIQQHHVTTYSSVSRDLVPQHSIT